MKKRKIAKPKARKTTPPKALLSRQWQSESTVFARAADAPRQEEFSVSDTSGPPPDPCKKCHIDFIESVVKIPWVKGGSYSAPSNVDTSKGGWSPDVWSGGGSGGATVSADGTVTFGDKGGTVGLSAGVQRCPKCKGGFILHVVQLQIHYDGSDITDKTVPPPGGGPITSGESVALSGVIVPDVLTSQKWQWSIPAITVKEFKVTTIGGKFKQGEKIDYTPSDLQKSSVTLHWVDGGAKAVSLVVTGSGISLTASATIQITRPTVTIDVTPISPQIQNVGPDLFIAVARNTFFAINPSPTGEYQWVQVGVFDSKVTLLNNQTAHKHESGLDGCNKYPHASGQIAVDEPSIAFQSSKEKTVVRSLNVTMYFMWKSAKGGVFVPLRSVAWWYNGALNTTGTSSAPTWTPITPPPPNPDFDHEPAVDQMGYPEWANCFTP